MTPEAITALREATAALTRAHDALAAVLHAIENQPTTLQRTGRRAATPITPRYCQHCGGQIDLKRPNGANYTRRQYEILKYCGLTCAGAARRGTPAIRKTKPEPPTSPATPSTRTQPDRSREARLARLQAAKAARAGVNIPLDEHTILATIENSSTKLTTREITKELTGRVNDNELAQVKRIVATLASHQTITKSRAANGTVAYTTKQETAA